MKYPTWSDYWTATGPKLAAREQSFEKIFKYLDGVDNPCVVETGTYRESENYSGDGCSTLLFDNYIARNGGSCYSVDIDPKACELANEATEFVKVFELDSIEFLGTLEGKIDLLYLDSYNIVDWNNDWEASAHHLKELFAAKDCLKSGTLIVVDDNITLPNGKRAGKGRLIYELMNSLGIEPYFDSYQVCWLWQEN